VDDAIEAYRVALTRIGQAEARHRHPLFQGTVLFKIAELQKHKGDRVSLPLARDNVDSALTALRSSNRLAAGQHIKRAEALKKSIEAALPRTS